MVWKEGMRDQGIPRRSNIVFIPGAVVVSFPERSPVGQDRGRGVGGTL